jgi:hypothetical protein
VPLTKNKNHPQFAEHPCCLQLEQDKDHYNHGKRVQDIRFEAKYFALKRRTTLGDDTLSFYGEPGGEA